VALKGNLLYNGDFETGTTEGWEVGPFGMLGQHTLTASEEAKLRGNYGGLLTANTDFAQTYLAYNKVCSFEEHEAYLFIAPFKMLNGFYNFGMLYGLDDKGNLLDTFWVGYNEDIGEWRKIVALLRGYSDITHFKVGMYLYSMYSGDKFYIDEVKLYPLKSVRAVELAETRNFENLVYDKTWYSGLACIGQCRLRSIVRVTDVSGTSPTLDITITIGLLKNTGTNYTVYHSQFTAEGFEERIIDLPEACWIGVSYKLGGDNPSFDIYHDLRLEPNTTVGGSGISVE